MTLREALRTADSWPDYLPIRRREWVAGLQIWWSQSKLSWMFTSAENAEAGRLPEGQGVLTPETMLADDWEVVTP